MGGDFGLKGICKAHEVVVFDRSALFAPFAGQEISHVYYGKFDGFVRAIKSVSNRLLPQHLLQSLKPAGSPVDGYTIERIRITFENCTAGVGRKDHKALRRKTMDLVWKGEISEEDRYSLLLAVALVRDTQKQKAKSTAYVTGLSSNIEHYHKFLDFPQVVKEKAMGYLWNGQVYAPVQPKVQTLL